MISATELEALLEENEGLRLEVRRLRGKRPADLCWSCEVKRRWLAIVGGNWIALSWMQSGEAWLKQNPLDISPDAIFWPVFALLSLGPLAGVYLSWKFRIFKRGEAWKQWPFYIAYGAYRDARRKRLFRR